MFWTKRKSLSENIDVIMQAKEQAAIKNQREALMAIEKAMHERAYNAPVSINLAAMKAFSIERLVKNGKVCTIIGYFFNNEVKEWILHISDEKHAELVEQFDNIQ